MNDQILNRARYFVDAEWPPVQEAVDILPELLRAYEELEEKYMELLDTSTESEHSEDDELDFDEESLESLERYETARIELRENGEQR